MFEECFAQQTAGETASPESTPLRLGDIQDPVPTTPVRNELNQLTSNATLAVLGGRFGYAAFVKDARVSEATAKALHGTAQELRHTILHGALTPSENSLAKLGWQRHAANDGISLWAVPEHRVLLSKNSVEGFGSIHGSAGAPSANLWRNADGSIFYANQTGTPLQCSKKYFLHSHDIISAQANGASTVQESGLIKRITLAESEMQKLAALEQHTNKSLHSSAMLASSEGLGSLRLTSTAA